MAELSITRGSSEGAQKGATQTHRAWSITINNPTEADIESWKHAKALHWVKDVIGQLEKGEEGTLHIQGMLKTDKVRFAAVKKAFPRAHIEPARNQNALETYVAKPETRVATIKTAKIATASDIQRMIHLEVLEFRDKHHEGKSFPEIRSHIEKNWEAFLDSSVERLMLQGYYGAEFVVCNPQVRSAYRRYIYPMVMRDMAMAAAVTAEKQEEKCDID